MKKHLVVAIVISILLLSFSAVFAATSSVDNLPGGAGIFYWQASPGGQVTLLNVQNVADPSQLAGSNSAAVTFHITFYDSDSNHILDFECPLSARDNWGAAITGDGTAITVTPQTPQVYTGVVNGVTGCTTPQLGVIAGTGADNLQYGYGTVAINRVDSANRNAPFRILAPFGPQRPPAGDGNGDARNELNLANTRVVLPDFLFVRTALLGPSGAFALNGAMLQGFYNNPTMSEDASDGWFFVNSIGVNALCAPNTVDWDGSGSFQAGAVTIPDFNGIDIHAMELYVTDNVTPQRYFIADGCTRAGRYRALGSADGLYWARYNVTPGLTDTTLVTVAPASNAHSLNPARNIADSRAMLISSYDDNETPVSVTPITPPEVGLSPWFSATNAPRPGNSSIGHSTSVAGEALITMGAPMYGYSATVVGGVHADLYPLVKNRINVEAVNQGIPDPAAGSDVIQLGF